MFQLRIAVLAAAAMILAGTTHLMAQVTMPHTFSAGTPARASEVNANFQAVVDALNAAGVTPIPTDGSYRGLQYSASNTMTGRNVVVMQAEDNLGGTFKRYAVRASYQNGTVNVNGTPTTFAYVRLLAFIKASATDALLGATVYIQGSTDPDGQIWNTEVQTYGAGASLTAVTPTTDTDTQTDDFHCFNAAISGQVYHCRLISKDTTGTAPTVAVDDSRILSLITTSFNAGPIPLTFPNGGVEGAYLSDPNNRSWFLLAKNIGIVAETRRHGVNADGSPNLVTYGVRYYRIAGVGTAGNVTSSFFSIAANQGFFFTP